ncbi:hypothetical protein IGI04_026738 [Brassica rapa subsp. trilocularis]|uniref:Uncharacterized protein n=1 Tax=Brassica rapa subsp. trilocularis TaxID=1813537 RepID=A0ABQ7KZG6_BRACM|nr:hypothetical protein IGI04_026738 [Brassica rapa subsp. trilocularis]
MLTTTSTSLFYTSYAHLCAHLFWAVLIRCRGQTASILEARNVKRGGEPMWMDLFMVDVNVSGFLFSSLYQTFWVNINNRAAGCSSTLLLVLIQLHRTFRSEIKTERHHWVAEYHERKHKKLKRYHRFFCVLQRDWQGTYDPDSWN